MIQTASELVHIKWLIDWLVDWLIVSVFSYWFLSFTGQFLFGLFIDIRLSLYDSTIGCWFDNIYALHLPYGEIGECLGSSWLAMPVGRKWSVMKHCDVVFENVKFFVA